MFHETQYRAGLAHEVKVGPALTKKSTWKADDYGDTPILEILEDIKSAVRHLEAILVTGPTRTSAMWVDVLEELADMSDIDTADLEGSLSFVAPDTSFRCITLDEVGTRTRVLLVNGRTPHEVDLSRHSEEAHEADALATAVSFDGAPHTSLCQLDLEALVSLDAFRL